MAWYASAWRLLLHRRRWEKLVLLRKEVRRGCIRIAKASVRRVVIDAAGIEKVSGLVALTIADAWDWTDERRHLLALQAKLNAYFKFVETGQIWDRTLTQSVD